MTDTQDKILVGPYPIRETDEQRKAREKRGEPLPHFSFMVSGYAYEREEDDAASE